MTNDIQILIDNFISKGLEDGSLCEDDLNRFSENIVPTLNNIVDLLFNITRENLSNNIKTIKSQINGFSKTHYRFWKEGLDLLEFYFALVAEAGSSYNEKYREDMDESNNYLYESLTRIQARQLQVGQEVLTLLKNGFADGAEARWRTAHELVVIGYFISEYGNECAERYLKHEAIESYKIIQNYKEMFPKDNYDFISEQEFFELRELKNTLCNEHGKNYATDYGWASKYINKNRPTFFDLEKEVGLDKFRSAYKFSCSNVHGSSRGTLVRLGLLSEDDILLSGPSNFGIATPAINITISILQMTTLLLKYNHNVDSYVFAHVLIKYHDLIVATFSKLNKNYSSYV